MSHRLSISAYTPSNSDPAILERILVQRQRLLRTVVRQLQQGMTNGEMHHILLVGPRGCGKTHFVTLAQDRLRQISKLKDVMRIAWLGEDCTIAGLIDLAVEAAEQLAEAYPDEFAFDFRAQVRSLAPNDAAEAILNLLVTRLGNRNLLLIMENLDRAFHGLGEMGQKKWRAFLQERGRIATLATSQQLFEGLSSRNDAFFGFFDIHHLAPLSVDDARELIAKIALENNNDKLAEFAGTSEGRYRVRALHHLAGGNHRMYVLLSEFLTKDSLDDLVSAFEQLADELTPYFQERLRSLAPQQARIVQALCNANGALTVKEIADSTFVAERNCSRQLGDLKQKKYVTSERRGKESYYEMAEPLMRLCLEVKNQRGKPLGLVASFLRAWFPVDELRAKPIEAVIIKSRVDLYCIRALEIGTQFKAFVDDKLENEIDESIKRNRLSQTATLIEEMIVADRKRGLIMKAAIQIAMGDEDATATREQLAKLYTGMESRFMSLIHDALNARSTGNFNEAMNLYNSIMELPIAQSPQLRPLVQFQRGVTYRDLNRLEESNAELSSIIVLGDISVNLRAASQAYRGANSYLNGVPAEALRDLDAAISTLESPDNRGFLRELVEALTVRGQIYREQGEFEKALADFTAAISAAVGVEEKAAVMLDRVLVKLHLRDLSGALADCVEMVEMQGLSESRRGLAFQMQGWCYGLAGETQKAVHAMESVLKLSEIQAEFRTLVLFEIAQLSMQKSSDEDAARALARAFGQGDPKAEEYGGRSGELIRALLHHGEDEWSSRAAMVVSQYSKHDCLAKLSAGVVQAIASISDRGLSPSQLNLWNSAWQEATKGIVELEVARRCLRAAVDSLIAGSDRALFDLPMELREIIRPLLGSAISP